MKSPKPSFTEPMVNSSLLIGNKDAKGDEIRLRNLPAQAVRNTRGDLIGSVCVETKSASVKPASPVGP